MKAFTIIFTIIAVGLIIFNITQVNFNNLFEGQSVVALITILTSLCAIVLLQVLRLSKKVTKQLKNKK
ncbi:hypothetical protein KO494_02020 [Lacinutrix sp. C3R15]|uniref:hypothetical protein n=1 Tax=Flavobacteriaceae TaxID=49546 RepID=UPI001C084BA4|nr:MULTISPECIES: hypothetical protein [Flavobacteriaceae]MBU2938306.1 hypothetical protein [Lacinutrix sp. C3R15]MDO6621620.1 hypothetical protein [Oceanihabitans sp. 1_MG-2023]